MDVNEHVYKDAVGKALTDSEGLDMVETVHAYNGTKLGATHFRGSRPIDAIWATKDLEITNACAMPIGYGPGDHRMIIVDFTTVSLVGENPQAIVRPGARRLNSKCPVSLKNYNKVLEELLSKHRLTERMVAAHAVKDQDPQKFQDVMEKVDQQSKEFMIHAEKKCRKLKCGKIPFSPEAAEWIKRCQFYRTLLRALSGRKINRGNLKRLARRLNISNPLSLSIEEVVMRLRECKQQCKYYQVHGQKYRRKFLNKRLEAAKEKQDVEAERRILQIIARERDRAFWRRLNYSLGKHRGTSVSSVQVKTPEGDAVELKTQDEVQNAIWKEVHQSRYHLAEEAPICQGKLRGQFGYNAESLAARQVLNGTYQFEDDFHEATKRICEAAADFREIVPENSVDQIITREIWQKKWKRKNEETSSSVSKLHFGHYISGAHSDQISDFHALKTSLALVHGIALKRWSQGLCVMLEKVLGCRLISKLRAILLMEADFNQMNKIIFGERMMDNVRKYRLMPEEIFSEKNREASDGGMSKRLFYDISRQLKRPAALASVDAANCYDRVAHAISSLVFQAFGTKPESSRAMHEAIQDMKFFLRTAFGDSKESVGARVDLKTQGFMQGNGAAPAGWAVVSITIIHAHKKEGHGATFLCPITKLHHKVAGILYVDDTDILHINLSREECLEEAHAALQASLDSWSQLLIATGGALKPEKCFYYLISYKWDRHGKWSYQQNETNEALGISVFLPGGDKAPIEHLSVNEARITLGMSSCPSGKADDKLGRSKEKAALSEVGEMREKAMKWANDAANSHLRPRDIHFCVSKKFWPKVKYGLCGNSAPFNDLVEAMHKPYWILAPLGGVIRSAKKELRYLDTGFYGVGFPHWGIEALIEGTNKIMTHFGAQSLLGVQYQMSAELLAIEIGKSAQPLLLDYEKYKKWATDCTLKSLWEKLHRFGMKLHLNTIPLKPPREGDRWFMTACEEEGICGAELEGVGQFRLHQQVIWESDVFDAEGRYLDERYKRKRRSDEQWSQYLFPTQGVTPAHLRLWKMALQQLAPGGRRRTRLGNFVEKGHKIWEWSYDRDEDVILRQGKRDGRVSLFSKDDELTDSNRQQRYSLERAVSSGVACPPCSVRSYPDGSIQLRHVANQVSDQALPANFLEVLQDWGCTWLWKEMQMTGSTGKGVNMWSDDGGQWMIDAIEDNSLVCVTDGSYIREMCPHLCSAAVIIECTKGRGRLVLSFTEQSRQANAYRGELLGLMAVHLILLAVNKVQPGLEGSAHIYSDCLGALDKVEHLPPSRIPSKCRHSDILKNIMLHCNKLTFTRMFSHVSAHQDDHLEWEEMDFIAQRNCGCDHAAKNNLRSTFIEGAGPQQPFPLEAISLFVGENKATTESGALIRFEAHLQEAKLVFMERNVLRQDQFELVDWRRVHQTLHDLPKMFQIFCCKQVFDISANNRFLHKRKAAPHDSPLCQSCTIHEECAGHVLSCPEEGRALMLSRLADELLDWLDDAGTPRDLTYLIVAYIKGRGETPMETLAQKLPEHYLPFARAQDQIGWRRFLEGMVAKELFELAVMEEFQEGCKLTEDKWVRMVIQKLLELTHGMWIYRNLTIHDAAKGVLAVQRKEKLLEEIQRQIELGGEDLAEEDKWMLEVNLGDLDEGCTGEYETYWLMAIKTAREHYRITNTGADGLMDYDA